MQKTSLALVLLVSLASLFVLSVLSNMLTGYPAPTITPQPPEQTQETDTVVETPVVMFKVSPVTPQLYWKIWTASYYTGLEWSSTTNDTIVDEFPQTHDENATKTFTVEINTTESEFYIPLASSNSSLESISLPSDMVFTLHYSSMGSIYKVIRHGQKQAVELTFKVSWRDVKVDDNLVSLESLPKEILDKYLQLPNISLDVWKTAKNLENPSYSVLDQILADVQYLRTNFVYDEQVTRGLFERIVHGSDVTSYLRNKRGVCIDAATALAIILRIQSIPSRISVGYKPGRVEEGKLVYFSTNAHAVTEAYLPPFGWVSFDATPPEEENPRVEVQQFKREAAPGSRLFFQLSITNRANRTDKFRLLASSKQRWTVVAAPQEMFFEPFQTLDALIEVTIPNDANFRDKDIVTATVVSALYRDIGFSTIIIVQAHDIPRTATSTTLGEVQNTIIRKGTFWVNGTVLTANSDPIDNVTIFVFLTIDVEARGVIVGKGNSKQGVFQIEATVPPYTEIGNYKLIPISLGTEQYMPSQTDVRINVSATTTMELGEEEEFLIGFGTIHGRLLWDNGTGIADALISMNITSLDKPTEVWQSQNMTLDDGFFRIDVRPDSPGAYKLQSLFSGNEFMLGSNATNIVKFRIGEPKIQITSRNVTVRGQVYNITGTVQFEGNGVWGEPITISFDNQIVATSETGFNGTYSYSFTANPEVRLGPHVIIVSLKRTGSYEVHDVTMKSKTMITTRVSETREGTYLLFATSLVDDQGSPIRGAEVFVDNYGLRGRTDENGNLELLIDTVRLWPGNLTLTARYEGSELYLPVTVQENVVVDFIATFPFLVSLILPMAVTLAVASAQRAVRKRQTLKPITIVEPVKEQPKEEEEFVAPLGPQPIGIVFADIEPQFPNVWGINEKISMEITVDEDYLEKIGKKNVSVLIDEQPVASLPLSLREPVEFSYVFSEKGKHKIRTMLPMISESPALTTAVELRIVDYVEEIVRLYNEFLKKLAARGIQIREDMTAQDVKNLISKVSDYNPEAVYEVTACFEKAEYSNQATARKDYEIIYLALKELNIDVK